MAFYQILPSLETSFLKLWRSLSMHIYIWAGMFAEINLCMMLRWNWQFIWFLPINSSLVRPQSLLFLASCHQSHPAFCYKNCWNHLISSILAWNYCTWPELCRNWWQIDFFLCNMWNRERYYHRSVFATVPVDGLCVKQLPFTTDLDLQETFLMAGQMPLQRRKATSLRSLSEKHDRMRLKIRKYSEPLFR